MSSVTLYPMTTPPCNPPGASAPSPYEALLDWRPILADGRLPLLIIRHGQTQWNVERRFLGRTDIPLDAEGHEQARRLGRYLAPLPIRRLVSSPLSRARATAEALRIGRPELPIELEPGLTELHQGELEGRQDVELPTAFPEFFAAWRTDPARAVVPGGEAMVDCQARGLSALLQLCAETPRDGILAVVTHQMVLAGVLSMVLARPLQSWRELSQKNTAVNLLSWGPDGLRAHRTHEASHLLDPCL